MKVWVIMGNDFPAGVKSTEAEAEAFCRVRGEMNASRLKNGRGMIYWRCYEFEVDEEIRPDAI